MTWADFIVRGTLLLAAGFAASYAFGRASAALRHFVWTAAFVALLARPGSLERVRSELGRIMEAKLEHSIETSHRSVLVPIAARWTLFPMMAAPRLIYQKIDTFAAIPTERD